MTAHVITIAQQKGGAGKTTLAIQLATQIAAFGASSGNPRKLRVGLVDTDPQASLTGWMRVREHEARDVPEIEHAMIAGWRLGAALARLSQSLDTIIVDSPPHAETDAREVIRVASLVVVPCQPSAADIWASGSTIELATRFDRPVSLVLNRVPPRGRSIDEALTAIRRSGYPLAGNRLGNRQAYVQCFANGRGVIENAPRSPAADEVRTLTDELAGLLKA